MIAVGLILCYFLQNLIFTNGMMLMLKWKYGFWTTQILWQVNTLFLVISRVFPDIMPYAGVLCPIFYIATQFMLVLFMFEDRIYRKLLAMFLSYTALTFSEVLVEVMNRNVFAQMHTLMYENGHTIRIWIMLEAAFIYLILFTLINIIWRRSSHDLRVGNILPALAIPLGQSAFIVAIQENMMFASLELSIPMVISMGAMVITDLFWIFWIIDRSRYEKVQRDLEKVQQEAALEKFHYDQVREKRKSLREICQNYDGQLQEILSLLQMSHNEEAESLVDGLAADIRSTRETPYCDIPVVNAILTAKNALCEEKKIDLLVDIEVEKGELDPLDLCSIFANLMDNAIAGVEEWNLLRQPEKMISDPEKDHSKAEGPGKAGLWIRLSAKQRGDYLVIKTENPAVPPAAQPKAGHGYGSKILKTIAEKYQGNYVVDYRDKRFTAVVTLDCDVKEVA